MDHSGLHTTVLLHEAIDALVTAPDGLYVDGTFGRGGHTRALLGRVGPGARVIAIDKDPAAIAAATSGADAIRDPRFEIVHGGFAQLPALLAERSIARIDGLLLDLGVSSPQFDDAARGFSFANDGPLDMRMDPGSGESAAQWLARAKDVEIADVLWHYGEERNSRRIARRVVETRGENPITSTAQLAALIAAVPGPRSFKIHPATRSFQAIRIHINGELAALEAALQAAPGLLAPGGRIAVISFHSLEDRMVKRFFRDSGLGTRDSGKQGFAVPRVPSPESRVPALKTISRTFPTPEEAE